MEIELRFIRKRGRHLGSILFTTLTSVKRCIEVGVTCYNCNIMPLYHLKIPIMYNASKHICIFELDSCLQHLIRGGGGGGGSPWGTRHLRMGETFGGNRW